MAVVHPSAFRGTESSDNIKDASPAFAQFVTKTERCELWNLPNIMNATGPADLLSQETGTAALAEINTSGICGFTLDADNEAYSVLWCLPQNIDVSKAINMRVLWSNSEAAATGTALFVVKYTPLTAGTTAMAVGATAMGTAITADADLAANVVQWSPNGVIAASTLTGTPGDDLLAIKTYVDVTTIADATMYELQVEFERRFI